MREMDILFPLPSGQRNADDMGLPGPSTHQPAATPRPESDVTPYPTMDITGPQGAGGSAADPSDAELIARRRVALGPLVIYESTDGNTTRKVLADDALRLQRVIRAAAIDAALAGEDGDGQ